MGLKKRKVVEEKRLRPIFGRSQVQIHISHSLVQGNDIGYTLWVERKVILSLTCQYKQH